jgi:hypothetical protein
VTDAADRAARQAVLNSFFAPGEERCQWRGVEAVANGKVGVADVGKRFHGQHNWQSSQP